MFRRVCFLIALLVLALTTLVVAQQPRSTYEQITVAGTAVGIASTTTNPAGRLPAAQCEAVLETAQVRFRDDGTDPTSSVGTPLNPGDILPMTGDYAHRLKFIRTTATSGVLNVRCYE